MRLRILSIALAVIPLSMLSSRSAMGAVVGPIATTTPIPSTLTDWNGTLDFAQFDPSLGTLLSVKLDLSASMSTVVSVTNSSLSSSNGNAKTEVIFNVQDSGNNLAVDPIDLISSAFVYSLGPGDSTSSGVLVKSGNSSDTYTSAAVLAAFTGLGTISLDAWTFTQTLLANTGGNTAADQVTDAELTGTVTYVYEPTAVPEASSVLMVALAGLGAAAIYRRRRS